jgi:NitT/TauT family transport system permease protein
MEKSSLSAPVVKPYAARPGPPPNAPVAEPVVRDSLAIAAVLAPLGAAVVALLAHRLLPNSQLGPPTHWYPLVLQVLLGAVLVVAVLQWAWRPLRGWARHYGPLVAGAIGWLAFWDTVTLKLALMPLPYFPGPDLVLQGLVDERTLLLESTYLSLRLLLAGYACGVMLGLASGILMGWFRGVRYWGLPIMRIIGPIPATALVPLAMVLFTNPFLSGAALIALGVWFPVTMLTTSGITNVPVAYFDVARTLGAGRGYLIFRVAIPAAMPTIFIGLFMGLLVSFLTLMVAETVGVRDGLAYRLQYWQGWAEYDKVYAVLAIMSVFFSSIITLMFKVRDHVLQWQKGVIRW